MTEPTIRQTVIGDHNIFTATGDIRIVYQLPPTEAEERRNLLILLNKVRQFWVEGVLEKSLYYEALIQLGKEFRPEMVEHPWERVLELPERSYSIPSEKSISQIFEETGRALLIVGEPGSGKTVTLLELARELITKAEGNPTQPIPVVFNLSTWAGQPIIDWLVSELSTKYQIPQRFGRPWLETNRLLLLLDGLDEVGSPDRTTCVTAINELVEQIGLPGLVVCSRLQEYLALPIYLKLSGAIYLQPLNHSQIEDYLSKAGPKLASLHSVLHDDPLLQELAETPLMLSVMSLAYHDRPVKFLSTKEPETLERRRERLFDAYIERMFKRKGKKDQPYARDQVLAWLSWFAQRMIQHSQTVFLIEELQPTWISIRGELWCYRFCSYLTAWLIFGLMSGVIFGLMHGLILGLTGWPEGGIVDWLTDGLIDGLIGGPIIGLLLGLGYELSNRLRGKVKRISNDIQPVEILSWSWAALVNATKGNIKLYLIIALIIGTIITTMQLWFYSSSTHFRLSNNQVRIFELIVILGYIILYIQFLGAIIGGLQVRTIDKKSSFNQGIILSIRNSISLGLISGLIVASITWLIFWLLGYISLSLFLWPICGMAAFFLAAISFGGMEVIKHYTLRLILSIKGYAPLNYARFLDSATKLIFLRKVGGGYIFIHQMLMEHFAAMGKKSIT